MNEYRWNDLKPGLSAQFTLEVTAEMMARFAEVSGDLNPLHFDRAFAIESGFKDRVAYGMLTSAFYSTLVGVHLPGKFGLLHGIDLEFRAPAFIGDRLTVFGEIDFLNEAYRRVELRARIRNDAGIVISRARIRAGVHGS